MPAIVLPEPNTALTISASASFFLSPPLSTFPLHTSLQSRMTDPSFLDSTVAPAFEVSFLDALASTRVVCAPFAAGSLSAVVLVSVDFRVGPSCGACNAMVRRSSTSQVPAFYTLSLPCAVLLLVGSLSGSASNAGASDATTFSRELTVARRQRDAAWEELAHVLFELY